MKRVLITGFLCAFAAFLLSWFIVWDWPLENWTQDARLATVIFMVVSFLVGAVTANETRPNRWT